MIIKFKKPLLFLKYSARYSTEGCNSTGPFQTQNRTDFKIPEEIQLALLFGVLVFGDFFNKGTSGFYVSMVQL